MQSKTFVLIASITLGGLLTGCGTHAATSANDSNNTVAAVSTKATQPSQALNVENTHQLYSSTTTPKSKPTSIKQKSSTTTTAKTKASTTTKSSTSSPKTTTTTVKTTTQPTKTTTTSTPSSTSTTTTKTSTSSGGNSSSSGSSSPAPKPSSVVTQYVTLPFIGTYPSGCQTVKMEYNKSTGVMEGFFQGISDKASVAWMIEPYSGTLYYSNNGGSTWLAGQKGVQYDSMPGAQGVSYTPNLVVKATTTSFYVLLSNDTTAGLPANGQFKIIYNSGSFSVTSA